METAFIPVLALDPTVSFTEGQADERRKASKPRLSSPCRCIVIVIGVHLVGHFHLHSHQHASGKKAQDANSRRHLDCCETELLQSDLSAGSRNCSGASAFN